MVAGRAKRRRVTWALGSRRFEVIFTGPGGHSWSDYGIGNPVHALGRAVALFTDNKLNGGPRSSFNVGLIDGGTSINSIPARARAKVDIRSESNEKMEELVHLLNAAVEDDGGPAVAQEGAGLGQEREEHLGEAGVGGSGDDEEGIAAGVIEPIVGGRRQGQAQAGDVGFGQPALRSDLHRAWRP